jgi:hypothetical protein
MNAGELIEELKKYPSETPVCTYDGSDTGDPRLITLVEPTDDKRPLTIWEPYLFIS